MGLAVWWWMLSQVSGRVTTVGLHCHILARSHSMKCQASQVGNLAFLVLYVNRCVIQSLFFPSPSLLRHLCQNTFTTALGFFSSAEANSVSSVLRWCLTNSFHSLQLSHSQHSPALFITFSSMACAFFHVLLKAWNGQLHLKPFHLFFKPISLTLLELGWYCWIQIEVVKWPYYPLKPGPALEIRVQELETWPVYKLYWIHNSSCKIKVNNTVGKPEQFKALFSPSYTHTYSPSIFTMSSCDT